MTEARTLMSKKIITIQATAPIQLAHDLMIKHNIRHLPVLDQNGQLVGMISDRDIQRASNVNMYNEIEEQLTFAPHQMVEDFMNWPVQTVDEKTPVADLARMMISEKVSAFVVNAPNYYMKGIITTEDLLRYLIEIVGHTNVSKQNPFRESFWKNLE
jgi:acetoin utilization protein AcuB